MKHKIAMFLQYFANPNTQVTTLKSDGNDLSPEMKVFYSKELLENARHDHTFNQFGKVQAIPANSGNKIEWRKISTYAPATKPLTEGVTPDGNKQNVIAITGSIDQYGDYTTVSDRLQTETIDPIVAEITKEHSAQMADTLNIITRNEVMTGTNVLFAGGKSSRDTLTASDLITPTLINQAATILKKAHTPKISGDFVAIIHPSVSYDLRESKDWIETQKYADPTNIYNGEIGKLHGVRFIEDADDKIWANSTGVKVYATIVMGADAYARIAQSAENAEVIVKAVGSAGTADPLNQRGTIGWKATHGAKVLYQERMIRIESSSSLQATDAAN